jgi:hypothetical protein
MEKENEWRRYVNGDTNFESVSFVDELNFDWDQIPLLDDVNPASSQGSQQSDLFGMDEIFPSFDFLREEQNNEEDTGPTEVAQPRMSEPAEQWLELLESTPYTPQQFDDTAQVSLVTTSSCSPLDHFPDPIDHLQGPVLHIPDTPADANNNSLQYDVTALVPAVVDAENLQIQYTNLMMPDVSSSDVTGEGDSTWGDDLNDDITAEFTEEYLFTVSTKELNRRIQQRGLSEDIKRDLKRRRRTIKNRGYARSCRQKRVGRHEEQDEEVLRLRREVKEIEQEKERLKFELQFMHAKCDALLAQREG